MTVEIPLVFECNGAQQIGILHLPDTNPNEATSGISREKAVIIIIVGGPQYRVGSHRQFVNLARGYSQRGIPVFRFDYRGMGDSDGELRTFESIDLDIEVAINLMNEKLPDHKIILMGLCDAASACLMYCDNKSADVDNLILMNPWARTEQSLASTFTRHYYFQRLLQGSFWAKLVHMDFEPRSSWRDLVANIRGTFITRRLEKEAFFLDRMYAGFDKFKNDILFVISGHDLTAREFMDMTRRSSNWNTSMRRPEIEIKTIEEADHTFSNSGALDSLLNQTWQWIGEKVINKSKTSANEAEN